MQAQLADLIMEHYDAAQALAEAIAEQEMGLPCFTVGALQARLDRCAAAVVALQAQLASRDALDDSPSVPLESLTTAGVDAA